MTDLEKIARYELALEYISKMNIGTDYTSACVRLAKMALEVKDLKTIPERVGSPL